MGMGDIIAMADLPPEIRKFGDIFEKSEIIYNLRENEIAVMKVGKLRATDWYPYKNDR